MRLEPMRKPRVHRRRLALLARSGHPAPRSVRRPARRLDSLRQPSVREPPVPRASRVCAHADHPQPAQEDEPDPLHAITCLLLVDGQHDDETFPRMISEACFPRLLELIHTYGDENPHLHRLLLQMMYEMSRLQRLPSENLSLVDDSFIHNLFGIIEGVSNDVHDPYHYPTIRVLVSFFRLLMACASFMRL